VGRTETGPVEVAVVTPPRLAEWIVERSLPADPAERDAVLGDLAEEYAEQAARAGAGRAGAWYWRQTLTSIGPNLHRRLTRPRDRRAETSKGDAMDSIAQDIRYGWRMVRRRPVMTSIALASLVIGVSLSAVVFSLLNAVLLRPLPVADPDRLAVLLEQRQDGTNHNFSYPDFLDYRAAQRTLTDLAAYSRADVTVRQPSGSQIVAGELVSGGYFSTLGVRLRFGRGIVDADDRAGAAPVVVVSDALWRQIAGETAGAFAPRTISINTRDFAIVGVAARPFGGMEVGRDARIWAPLHLQPVLDPSGGQNFLPRRTTSWLTVIGRLRSGVRREQAAADLTSAEQSIARAGGRPEAKTLTFAPGRQGDSMLPERTGEPLRLLLGAALLVLVIACANVANLLLARATERAREIAVRSALGAGRGRLARLVLIETLLLGAAGALASLFVARWMADFAVPFISRFGDPVTLDVGIDWRLVLFVAAAGLGATVLAGIAPMLSAFRTSPAGSLGEAGRPASAGPAGQRMRRGLIVAQFALSLALVVVASLLARTVQNLRAIPTGFDLDHVALIGVDPEAAGLDAPRTRAYLDAAIDRAARVPGVRAAGFGRVMPLGFGGSRTTIGVPAYQPAPGEDMEINFNIVSASYFEAMGIALTDGRVFETGDIEGRQPVAVVNQTMAARYWPNQRATGQRIRLGDASVLVVGVARDVKYRVLREEAGPSFYLPLGQERPTAGVIHVRTQGDPRDVLDTLRRLLADVDPSVPITTVRTLRNQATLNLNDERLAMTIGVILGGAALLLAAVGLYGSMSYAVGQRTRELGVRMALGATARDIRRLVLGQGIGLSVAGTLLGAALAVWLARSLESRLFGVRPADLPTLFMSAALLAAVAVFASWVPARRATRVDPVNALRVD
jgi:putative ABC transport system permease protein